MLVEKDKRFLLCIDASRQNRILVTGKNVLIFILVSSTATYVCMFLGRLLELICLFSVVKKATRHNSFS